MTNTLFLGKVYLQFDELPSTNDYARELLAKSTPPEGTAIRAASQSAGRGQFGSTWESQPGKNLLISVILYPGWLPATAQFRLSEVTALALRETITEFLEPSTVRIKWPNDIYIDNRKTAGILIQNTIKSDVLVSSVVGIGLNVNQLDFPKSLPDATSMALAAGTAFDLERLTDRLFTCLERRYLQLKSGQTDALRADYHAHLLALGEVRDFARSDGARFEAVIQGVAMDGRLILHSPKGVEQVDVKAVRML